MAWPTTLYSAPYPIIFGSQDPTAVATAGAIGALFIKLSAPIAVYQKLDNGKTVNWQVIGSGFGEQGSWSSPYLVASGASAIPIASANTRLVYLQGNAGPVVMTVDPPISDANGYLGKEITFIGVSTANYVTLQSGNTFNINGNAQLTKGKTLTVFQASVSPLIYLEKGRT